MRAVLICFSLYILTIHSVHIATFEEGFNNAGTNSISKCIVKISNEVLSWKPTVVLKTEKGQPEGKHAFIEDVIAMLSEANMPYMKVENILRGTLNVSEASYLVIGYYNDCNTLAKFNLESSSIESKVKYLIILENYSIDTCRRVFKEIAYTTVRYKISSFIKKTKDMYELLTYIIKVAPETCKIVHEMIMNINSCTNGTLQNKKIFPIKNPKNMNKCPIKVGVATLFPFTVVKNLRLLKTYDSINVNSVKGMDLELIKIIATYFNATLELHYLHKNHLFDREFVKFLLNKTLDICMGGLSKSLENTVGKTVDYSGAYAGQKISWIYYVERPDKTWLNLFMNMEGLYLFITFYFIYSAVWYLICNFDKDAVSITDTLLYAWGMLVGTDSLQDARTMKQKILNAAYLMMCLHLAVYINAQLYVFLTVHIPPNNFHSNEDIIKSGRPLYLKPGYKRFISNKKYIDFANNSVNCESFNDCIAQIIKHNGITLGSQGIVSYAKVYTAVDDEARILNLSEQLIYIYIEMIVAKGYFLGKKLKQLISDFRESGLSVKLYKEAVGLGVTNRAKQVTHNLITNSYRCQSGCKLSLQQFEGVFYVLFGGYVVSCVIFIFEIIVKKCESIIITYRK